MPTKTKPVVGNWIPVTVLQLVSFIMTVFGIIVIVLSVKNNLPASALFSGLFLSFGGSATGLILTLYSLRHF